MVVAQDVRLVLRASSRLHQAMEWRTLCVLLVLAASIRAALRRPVRTKQPHVPLVQQDMVATALRALLAQHVSLTRTARLRLTLVHVSHATRMPQLLVVWRTTAVTTALQEAAMPDTMVPL